MSFKSVYYYYINKQNIHIFQDNFSYQKIHPGTLWSPGIPYVVFEADSRRDYAGAAEYQSGTLERLNHEAGWWNADGRHTAAIRDWQGSLRATWTEGDYTQTLAPPSSLFPGLTRRPRLYKNLTAYYPYGLPFADRQGTDRYLYSGKELDRTYGLQLYDFHARTHDPQLARFLTPDPCAERYPATSPYAYCAANPIAHTDPTGREFTKTSEPSINDYTKLLTEKKEGENRLQADQAQELLHQVDGLKSSSLMIDIIHSQRRSDGVIGLTYYKDGMVIVEIFDIPVGDLKKVDNLDIWACLHELTHVWQFEMGEIAMCPSLDEGMRILKDNGDGGAFPSIFLYDITDEYQAYGNQGLVDPSAPSKDQINNDPLYEKLPRKSQSIKTLPEINNIDPATIPYLLQGYSNRYNVVFRYEGQTYQPQKK